MPSIDLRDSTSIQISISFSQQIKILKENQETQAFLIGRFIENKNTFLIYRTINCSNETDVDSIVAKKHNIEKHLPEGFEIIGCWLSEFDAKSSENSYEYSIIRAVKNDIDSKMVVLCDENLEGHLIGSNDSYDPIDGDSEPEIVTLQQIENDSVLYNDSVTLRLNANLTLHLQVPNLTADFLMPEIETAFVNLEAQFDVDCTKKITRSSNNVFRYADTGIILTDGDSHVFSLDENLDVETSTVLDLIKLSNSDDKKSRKKIFRYDQAVLDFTPFEDITAINEDGDSLFVPVIHCLAGDFTSVKIPLQLKPLIVCSIDTKLSEIPDLFNRSILRQLRCARECIVKYSDFRIPNCQIVTPDPFWYLPAESIHFICVFYPKSMNEDDLIETRKEMCQLWSLPIDRPKLKRANVYIFPNESGAYLINVHEYLTSSNDMGIHALVQGNYEYRHYMQDSFDDNGWGCAYRSFQTVWSWFLLQGFTTLAVPNHRQIQQALVDVGDRPEKFVGTRQWIGSLELSYCLSHMLNIESKILNVLNRDELCSKVRELIQHFQIEGTPIMIGGGVLAHTIIGVQFSEETGDMKFLVLDPHYTGDENPKTITDKGWCGWKAPSFWNGETFYNLLLPQRPRNVI